MADETTALPIIEGPGKNHRKNGKGSKPGAVPQAKARVAGQPDLIEQAEQAVAQTDPAIDVATTQAIPEVHGPDGNGHSNGNGKVKPAGVRPVKARVTEAYIPAHLEPTDDQTNGNGHGNANGNGH